MKIFIYIPQEKTEQTNIILKLETLSEIIGLPILKLLLFAFMSSGIHRLPPYKSS